MSNSEPTLTTGTVPHYSTVNVSEQNIDIQGVNSQDSTLESIKKRNSGLQIVRYFHLSWFAMTMGWGGVALTIEGFPGATGDFKIALNIIGTVIWFWDLLYLIVFSIMFVLRMAFFPIEFWKMMKQPVEFLFFGCFPMAIGVVGMGFITFGPNIFGNGFSTTCALVLFWLALALCLVSMLLPVLMMIVYQVHTFDTMTSLWLLPFVSCVVCSAQASVVGPAQSSIDMQLNVLISGYILWGAGILTAAPIIAVYTSRLILHGFPYSKLGNSLWVVLGPIGQGANAIIHLGRNTGELQCSGVFCGGAANVLENCACTGSYNVLGVFGYIAPGITFMIGLTMYGYGLFWLFLATSGSFYHIEKVNTLANKITYLPQNKIENKEFEECEKNLQIQKGMPFGLGHWGVVFPMVTLIMATYQLHIDSQFAFFLWMGRILAVILVAVAFYIHGKTLQRVFSTSFWYSFHS